MTPVSIEGRRRIMQACRSKDTKPEVLLRRALWAQGVRGWRLHRNDIPGTPDVAFIGRRVAVFVDGAFWHGHPDKYWPGRSGEYWDNKIARNMERDREVNAALEADGWKVVRVWDFEVEADPLQVAARVRDAIEGP